MTDTRDEVGPESNPSPDAFPPLPQTDLPEGRSSLRERVREFMRSQGREPVECPVHVLIPGGHVKITESAEQLFTAVANTKQLFYRGGAVVELVNEGDSYAIEVLDAAAAQSRFEKYVTFFKQTSANTPMKPATLTKAIAEQYLSSEACRTLLPKLSGILHCPLMTEQNGRLHVAGHGYDETTGFYVDSDKAPDAVTLQDAVECLASLLSEFDFVTPSDRSRAIASLLTPALKLGGFIKGPIPVDVAEADVSQSGKTYRQRMVAALYNQKPAVVTKKAAGVGGMEETFNDHLVHGRTFIQFDNVRGKLDSQCLESFLTADGLFSVRIPYHGNMQIDPSKFVLFISSNGFEATKDLANRSCIIRIRKRHNHLYRVDENGKDILQLMFGWNSELIGWVFAIIREWHRQGKPRTKETRHDFREWCQILDWIVQNIFKAAPLMDDHEQAKERASNPQQTWLREVAIKLKEQHKLNDRLSAASIGDICTDTELAIPGLAEDKHAIRDEVQKQIGRIFSKLFGDKTEIALEDFKVVKREHATMTQGDNRQMQKTYTFSLLNDSSSQPPPTPDSQAPVFSQAVPETKPPSPPVGLGAGNETGPAQPPKAKVKKP